MNQVSTDNATRELMKKYNKLKAEWFEVYDTYDGFDEWFTTQVIGK